MAKPKKPPPPGPGTSFRFDDDTRDILEALAVSLGTTLTGAARHAVRLAAQTAGIKDAEAARKYLVKRGER